MDNEYFKIEKQKQAHRESQARYYETHKEKCYEMSRECIKRMYAEKPWMKTLKRIQTRLTYRSSYKGLEFTITAADLEEIWKRDKASEMEHPSIDRINPYKGYTKENCRYLELSENLARERRKTL